MQRFNLLLLFLVLLTMAATTCVAQNSKSDRKASSDSTNPSRIYKPTSGPLFNEIARLDSIQFAAFNARDLNKLMGFFDPNLELYQDNEGVRNYAETRNGLVWKFIQLKVMVRLRLVLILFHILKTASWRSEPLNLLRFGKEKLVLGG